MSCVKNPQKSLILPQLLLPRLVVSETEAVFTRLQGKPRWPTYKPGTNQSDQIQRRKLSLVAWTQHSQHSHHSQQTKSRTRVESEPSLKSEETEQWMKSVSSESVLIIDETKKKTVDNEENEFQEINLGQQVIDRT